MLLQVEKGSFYYTLDTPILQNITFSLEEGEVIAIMGPNGIGKTTLLKCLLGILKWKSGRSIIEGKDTGNARKQIGYVPQAHRFSFPYSVRDMVVFGRAKYLSAFASPTIEDYKLADQALDEVGILSLKDKSCNRLSGGQLQMVLIARALVGQPRLLILDEPESHLDFCNQLTILKIIKGLAKEKGIACIMNTHYPNHALDISDKTLLLNGKKFLVGKTNQVLTEENMRAYFGVNSIIVNVQTNDREINTVVLTDLI
jgi:iron complex transport system ATP-binding protein